jgi:site-specific DNA-methyltransferase (adenine-specific)
MFGGTRMWHRLASGMEDAGFEMWDTLMWLHGQGFPKAQDISKLIDKVNGDERALVEKRIGPVPGNHGGSGSYGHGEDRSITASGSEQSAPWSGHKTCALKPAWEPVLCFRAPSQGKTYAELAQMFGSGALYVDGGRIGTNGEVLHVPQSDPTKRTGEVGTDLGITRADIADFQAAQRASIEKTNSLGRYPANLALDEESAEMLDEQSGDKMHGAGYATDGTHCCGHGDKFANMYGGNLGASATPRIGDAGGASRFFYCAKSSTAERHSGIDNNHPTVKPVDLCTWLATLLLPPASVDRRRLLVPFSGSGSEMIGALGAGWDEVVGVESDAAYCDIARARIKHHNGLQSADGTAVIHKVDDRQPELF